MINKPSSFQNVLNINTITDYGDVNDNENENNISDRSLLLDNETKKYGTNDEDTSSVNSRSSLIRRISLFDGVQINRSYNFCLYLTDVLLSIFVFSPIVCIYWYCTWLFFDKYFLKEQKYLSNSICLGLGLLIILIGYLTQDLIKKLNDFLKNLRFGSFLCFLMRIIYFYIITLAYIMQWRAIWNFYVFLLDDKLEIQISLAILSLAYFCLTRSTRALISSPYLLYLDDRDEYFVNESGRHKIKTIPTKWLQFLIDYLIIEIVECFIMNFIWFGFQNYFDILIFPNDYPMRLAVTFACSHVICLFVLLIQYKIFNFFSKYSLVPRLIIEDSMNIIMIISTTVYWKFYWDLCEYLLFDKEILLYLYLAGHLISFAFTVLANATGILVGPDPGFFDGEIKFTKSYFDLNFASDKFKEFLLETNNNEKENERTENLLINPNA